MLGDAGCGRVVTRKEAVVGDIEEAAGECPGFAGGVEDGGGGGQGKGEKFDLAGFVDPETASISWKSEKGRGLLALEHPGLWNGSMAFWNTIFVEVPLITFNPVKTITDLIRPQHLSE